MDFVLKKELSNFYLVYVNVLTPKKFNEARNFNYSKNIVVVKSHDEEISRASFENKNVDIFIPESSNDKDFIHFRKSELNQVLCKLAKKNNIAIGFGFSYLVNSEKREILLGRMMQNVFLCRKYKLKIVLGSFANKDIELRNKSELMSFGKVIGMNGNEIKQSLNFRKKEDLIKKIK